MHFFDSFDIAAGEENISYSAVTAHRTPTLKSIQRRSNSACMLAPRETTPIHETKIDQRFYMVSNLNFGLTKSFVLDN